MQRIGKLELTWVGKYEEKKNEPRILIEDKEKSYGDPNTQNMLIHGDNLLALKALEQDFAGRIKCVFIDPPYNTGSAFKQYEDGIEHSIWLSLMKERLIHIFRLLSTDGSLWITIDDNEAHYLKVLCDEIFGRNNFVANVIWEKAYSERMDSTGFSNSHDHILVYRKSEDFKVNQLEKPQNEKQFNYFDDKVGKYYRRRSLRKEGSESRREDRPSMWYPIEAPDGSQVFPIKPDGTQGRWRWKKDNLSNNPDLLEFVNKGGKWEIYVKQYLEENATRPPSTLWKQEEVGHNHEAKLEVIAFNKNDVFDTPKPERLISRVLTIATHNGDLVLDSFLGSGTTAAVAHKMGRKWIGIERGNHCYSHCLPRLQEVINGSDQGGISQTVGWQGGGGFKFYELAEPLLVKDTRIGTYKINPEYSSDMIIQAICKIEGFKYKPQEDLHGYSSEKRFIHVTTNFVNQSYVDILRNEIDDDWSLIIYCTKRQSDITLPYNIEIKRIPKDLLLKCSFESEEGA